MRNPKRLRTAIRKHGAAYLMLLPFLLFFVVFTVIPVVLSLPVSLTEFNLVQMPKFVGLSNFSALLLNDPVFWQAVRVTLVSAIFTGPVSYLLSFLLAWMLHQLPRRLRTVMTLIFYVPSMASIYTVWKLLLSGDTHGYLNALLLKLGVILTPVQWLTDGSTVLGVTIVVQLWLGMGAGFLALCAGFSSVDRTLYEAGAIEGIRNRWQELLYITVPAMAPQMLFAAVMQIVAAFAAGSVSQNLVGFPSTDYRAHTLMNHAYDYGWIRFEMGYAAAICLLLFGVMLLLHRLVRRLLGRYLD